MTMPVLTAFVPEHQIKELGINSPVLHYQLSAEELTEQTLRRNEGVLNNTGALCVLTGTFTGRSPKTGSWLKMKKLSTALTGMISIYLLKKNILFA